MGIIHGVQSPMCFIPKTAQFLVYCTILKRWQEEMLDADIQGKLTASSCCFHTAVNGTAHLLTADQLLDCFVPKYSDEGSNQLVVTINVPHIIGCIYMINPPSHSNTPPLCCSCWINMVNACSEFFSLHLYSLGQKMTSQHYFTIIWMS